MGGKRVSPRVYWLSAFLVFFGSHLSGLWIIIANSWMQTPAGFKMVAGRAVLTDFFAAALNPSTLPRYLHTITSGWITGAFMAAGISAWYLLQKRHDSFAKTTMRVALTLAAVTSLVQLGLGHYHAVQVAETQPAKLAAIEGIFKTQRAAPMVIFGIPNEQTRGMDLAVEVPAMLSLLVGFDVNTEIKGLDSFPAQDRPPVMVPFVTNKLMVALGMFFIGFSWLGLLLMLKGWLWKWPLFLKAMVLAIPLPHLAVQGGWISAEVGRQPWVVYGLLRTAGRGLGGGAGRPDPVHPDHVRRHLRPALRHLHQAGAAAHPPGARRGGCLSRRPGPLQRVESAREESHVE